MHKNKTVACRHPELRRGLINKILALRLGHYCSVVPAAVLWAPLHNGLGDPLRMGKTGPRGGRSI